MRPMKYSGIEWIGEVPEGWEISQLRTKYSERKHKNTSGDEKNLLSLSYGNIVRKDIKTNEGLLPESFNGYNVIESHDIVMRLTDLQNDKRSLRTGLAKEHGIITSAYVTLQPILNTNSSYYHYLLHAYDLAKVYYHMGGGLRQSLDYSELCRIKILVPPKMEQSQIVSFLDRKCSAIDVAIAKTQESIAKLEEYKKSVITKAVTKGIEPDVKMKDSGVEWIGKVPEGWALRRGKFILKNLSRPVRNDDKIITCFRDGEVTLRENRRTEGFTLSDKEIGYQGINEGDLVIHGMDGFAGSIGISDSRGKATPVLIILDSNQNKKFLMYYLRSMAYSDVFNAIATGIRVRSCNLNWNKLAELPYPVPSLSEQQKIVDYIDNRCVAADKLITMKQSAIDKWAEYKKSLIYYVVTGKIDCTDENMSE